jgi:hypothetical protein
MSAKTAAARRGVARNEREVVGVGTMRADARATGKKRQLKDDAAEAEPQGIGAGKSGSKKNARRPAFMPLQRPR